MVASTVIVSESVAKFTVLFVAQLLPWESVHVSVPPAPPPENMPQISKFPAVTPVMVIGFKLPGVGTPLV